MTKSDLMRKMHRQQIEAQWVADGMRKSAEGVR